MTAHKYLRQLYDLDRRIKAQQLMLEELTAAVLSAAAPPFDKDCVQNSADFDRTRIKRMETEQRLKKNRLRYLRQQNKIINQVAQLSGTSQEILTRRYIKYQGYQQIADEMNYSIQHLFRLRKVALDEFERRFLC